MIACRLQGNAIFSSNLEEALQHYYAALDLYETERASDSLSLSEAAEEYTKSAGNALTCLSNLGRHSECATLAYRALRVNPILAKANAFLGKCMLTGPSLSSCENANEEALMYLCRALYELPTLEPSCSPLVAEALHRLNESKQTRARNAQRRVTENDALHIMKGDYGYGVIAKSPLEPGTVVADLRTPFSVGLYEETSGRGCCLQCGLALELISSAASVTCSVCQCASYCSLACHEAHKKQHDNFECHYLLKLKEVTEKIEQRPLDLPDDFYETAFHCITTLSSLKACARGYERLRQLESHTEALTCQLGSLPAVIIDLLGLAEERAMVLHVIGVVRCNALELVDSSGLGVGQALYCEGVTSAFNHSCEPNCAIDATTHRIVTTRTICAGDELCISYLPQLFWPARLRQQHLSEHYFFTCHCNRCRRADDDPFEKALQMELPGARDGATKHYHVQVQSICTRVRAKTVDAIRVDDRRVLEELYKRVGQELFSFHYLCHELRNTLCFVYSVLGDTTACLGCCLHELLMWEAMLPGVLPVKMMKLRNALHCANNVKKSDLNPSAAVLYPYMVKLALLYDVAELVNKEDEPSN